MTANLIHALRQFCADVIAMHRGMKIAIMVAADLVALPFCILIAMLLRVGDQSTGLNRI